MMSFRLALRRMRARPTLSILIVVGLSLIVAIPVAIPMYSDASTSRVLSDQDFQDIESRPPFSYLFTYRSALVGAPEWDDVAAADEYLRTEGIDALGLPTESATSFLDTVLYQLEFERDDPSVIVSSLAIMEALADLTTMVEGRLPESRSDGVVEATINTEVANSRGLTVGMEVTAVDSGLPPGSDLFTLDVEIVGLWEAIDPDDERWIIPPDELENRLFVERSVIMETLGPEREGLIRNAAWFAILDASSLSVDDVDEIIDGADTVSATATSLLPGLTLQIDPVDGLNEFKERSETLTRRLTAYALPVVGLILVFVTLVVSLSINDRKPEIAVLRSRGASRGQLVRQVAIEATILTTAAVALGMLLSVGIARLMGRAVTFMNLSGDPLPDLSLTTRAVQTAIIVGILSVVLLTLPVIGASKATIASQGSSSDRSSRKPWWQRTSLDLIIVAAIVAFGYQMLRSEPNIEGSVLDDPVIIVFPALVAVAVGLLALRILPMLSELAARFLAYTPSVVALVATRRAARAHAATHIPLLLLVVTVSLAIFTASLALTLDLQLFDETYHKVGAEVSVYERDSMTQPSMNGVEMPRVLVTVDEYEAIPGVAEVTRVALLPGRIQSGEGQMTNMTFFGIDADTFGDVAFYRTDYEASNSIADGLLRLEASPDAILVHPSLGLSVGDVVRSEVLYEGVAVERHLVVAGSIGHFPTWYPEDHEVLVVGNLDPVFLDTAEAGEYRVWMRLDPGAGATDVEAISTDLRLVEESSAVVEISVAREEPERQGVFGLLTVAFLTSLVISILGFFFATLFEIRGSAVELGVLQALGLTPRQVAGIVVTELAVVMGGGVVVGVVTGWLLSRQLIVRLVGDSGLTAVPPLIAEVDRGAAIAVLLLLVGIFAVSALALVGVLRRMKLFETLKLGEAP